MYREINENCEVCEDETLQVGNVSREGVFTGACTVCGWETEHEIIED